MRQLEMKILTSQETYKEAILIEVMSRNECSRSMRHRSVGDTGGDKRQNILKGEGVPPALLALHELWLAYLNLSLNFHFIPRYNSSPCRALIKIHPNGTPWGSLHTRRNSDTDIETWGSGLREQD
jgi:hypothetical protein